EPIHLVCPCSVLTHCPLLISQTLTSPSKPALNSRALSGWKASDQTSPTWPGRANSAWPSVVRQTRISPLLLPPTTYCPLALRATEVMPLKVSINAEPARSEPAKVVSCPSASCKSACQMVSCEKSLPFT